jgi:predicted AAA+ superfamily ATPase
VGKSTLLAHLFGDKAEHIVFDPVVDVGNARRDPEFFLNQHPPPLILDEIQYAPELLGTIKRRIDRQPAAGQYFLTGSQNLALLKNVSESLAGRVIVLDVGPMTPAELNGCADPEGGTWLASLLDAGTGVPSLAGRFRLAPGDKEDTVYRRLWRGGLPLLLDRADNLVHDILSSYVRTYVERDVRAFAEVSDQQQFTRFLALCAALTAQETNHSQLGRELGVTPQTAGRWLAILRATFQWIELPPFAGSAIKRISGRPKGYLSDTGLAAHLQRLSSPTALEGHPALGALFETAAVGTLMRGFGLISSPPQVYHWRTHGGAEVDVLLERDGIFWPIEIKAAARITSADARGIKAFRATYPHLRHGTGVVIAGVEAPDRLSEDILIVPYDLM